MLSLRKSISGKLPKRRSVDSSSSITNEIEELTAESPTTTMATTHPSNQQSRYESNVKTETQTNTMTTTSSHVATTRVVEITRSIRDHVCHLEEYDDTLFEKMDLPSYLEYVDDERLFHMPRRGSDWDRVLRAAQFFGVQLWSFAEKLGSSNVEIQRASITALASCRVLLDIGHGQAAALAPTFDALYELGIMLSHVSQIHDLFCTPDSVQEIVADLYSDVIELIGHIAVHYRKRINNLSDSKSVTINFDAAFGRRMVHIWETKETLTLRMWRLKLGNNGKGTKLEAVRQWLKPERSTKAAYYDRLDDGRKRAEDTCEWLKPHLVEFLRSKDTILTITGNEGSGKTVLSGWIEDRLQRPLNHTQYHTLSFAFDTAYPDQCSQLPFLKGILFQLIERNVGDVKLFEKLAEAYAVYSKHGHSPQLETTLWTGLEAGLQTLDNRHSETTLIIDGVEEIAGQRPVDFVHALRDRVKKFHTTKVVMLSKGVSHLSDGSKHISLTPQHLHDDIRSYFRQSFASLHSFKGMDRSIQTQVLDELAHQAKASFIWAYVVCRFLCKQQVTPEKFHDLCRSIPDNFDGATDKLLTTVSLKDEVTKHMLAAMLVAQRPFRVSELSQLLSVNVQRRQLGPPVDILKHVRETCVDLVVISRGRVLFKSKSVRTYMYKLLGKSLPSLKDTHQHITMALLAYIKLTLKSAYEPSFEPLTDSTVGETLRDHILLSYAVENWLAHFKSTTFITAKGELHLTSEFRSVFPDTCQLALLEQSCWHNSNSTTDLVRRHDLSLHVREACFGQKHISVFQTLVILGTLKASSTEHTDAAELFYHAVQIGRETLSRFDTVVVTCTNYFLQLTETMKITSRTQMVTYREEMILFMVEICKARHSSTDDAVIKWYKNLSQLYISINEEHRATVIYKELYEIYVVKFGKKSSQAREMSEHLGNLHVTLNRGNTRGGVTEYESFILESTDELDIADEKRTSVLLRLATSYESQRKWLLAEKIYITLWRRFSQLVYGKASLETHLTRISIALEYSKFLQKLKRSEEASNILICVWAEYEHSSFEHESIVIRIREIGVMLKSFGLCQVALSVFGKVWSWFKSSGQLTSDEALRTCVLITEVVEESTERSVNTQTTTIMSTQVTEQIVREVFETHYERCKKSKVDGVFFSSTIALVNLYIKAENWVQAEIIIRRTLELTWKAVLTSEATVKLTEEFASESILVAQKLALCYHRQRVFEKAESIYLRVFNACLTSLRIEDVRVLETCEALVSFYEEYHRHEKIIDLHVLVLEKARKQLGTTNKLTIRLLYTLASESRMLGRREAYTYYSEIFTSLNKTKKHCHPDAFDAAIILVEQYNEEKSWAELQHICAVLWETFIHHGKSCNFTEEIVQLVYLRYNHVLEHHASVQQSVLYNLSVEYRDTVKTFFGQSSTIFITAMLAHAKVCEQDEKHYQESVDVYDEVLKKITTTRTTALTVKETTISIVKRRLTKMYVAVLTSTTSTTMSTTTIERAINLSLECYAQLKIEFGCWHEETFMKLKDIVVLHQKFNTQDSSTKIIGLLQGSFTDNLIATSSSVGVYQAAVRLATIYIEAGFAAQASKLVQQVRHLMIFGNSFDAEFAFKVDKTLTRGAFVFLVAFEQRLASETVMHYSEIMAGILFEMTLYEQYIQAAEGNESTEVILEHGAKLRAYWVETKQEHHIAILDKKMFQIFKHRYGSLVRSHDDHTRIFFQSLIIELGRDRAKVDFTGVSCRVGNAKVAALLEAGDFRCAIEVARCTFGFVCKQGFYNDIHHVSYAFQLAEYMAGIDVRKPADPKLQESAQALSREITTEVLTMLRTSNIEFFRMNFETLEGVIRLLGAQGLFNELEDLLNALWESREVQKTWNSTRVLTIGRMLVHAHAANQNVPAAIELCDRICYNLRRSRGVLDDVTLEMSEMLAALDTYANHIDRAMSVHEQILREIDAACVDDRSKYHWHFWGKDAQNGLEKDYEHHHLDTKVLASMATQHFELLKRAHFRMGGWTKPEQEFQQLYEHLSQRLGKSRLQVSAPDTWDKTAASSKDKSTDALGTYVPPREWKLDAGGLLHDGIQKNGHSPKLKQGPDHVFVATQQWLVS